MNLLNTIRMSRDEIDRLLESALRFKHGGDLSRPLAGKSVVLEPGATSWTLEHRAGVVMDADKTEHVAEFVRVLERYCAAIGVRTFASLKNWKEERTDPVLNAFANYASVPIIN